LNGNRLIAWAFAALEVGRSMIQMRGHTDQLDRQRDELHATVLPAGWRAAQDAWLTALAEMFVRATPAAASNALLVTRRTLDLLPPEPDIAVDAAALVRYRMRALLHFTELTLTDDTLGLGRPAQTHVANGVRT
jgi:hypothetical protein